MKQERPPESHVRLGFFRILFDENNIPHFAIFYREENFRGHFTKYSFYEIILSAISVSDPYSLNPDPDPATNLNPDPDSEEPIRINY